MKSDEAVDVAKGAYSSYGYSYVLEHIYFPDRVREMNKQDELISYVCVTTDGEVIAHCALEMEEADPKIPQLGVAFTKPKYRGQGCLNRMAACCMDDAENRGLYGVYARGVTTHPYSQKSLLNFDLLDCAIYISSGAIREYKGIEGTKQRESVMIHFKCLNPNSGLSVYPPIHHKEIIDEIYNNIKLKPQFKTFDEKLDLPECKSVIDIQTDQLNMVGKIRIKEYGIDILSEIQKNLKALCMDRMDTIYLYLNLSDPFTAKYTEEFEKSGFFFGGVIPGSDNGDMLMLQYLNNYKIDYDKIKVASDSGNKLLEYIKRRDVG
ncbi:MAG: GNAT family N-acetyltransferase [Bacteroidetes bacterium]|nr:GNAT family N-acetyltransferase [Bacteroidota bacterium]